MLTSVSVVARSEVAVVNVDDTGRGTLHLGGVPVDHATAVQAEQVIRMLLDYAATIDHNLLVVTRRWDGRMETHELRPNGSAAPLHGPLLSSEPTRVHSQQGRCRGASQVRRAAYVAARASSGMTSACAASGQWLAGYGPSLIPATLILLLLGCVVFLGFAPHLWLVR
jgi:hypothetical protein